jgi:hypothetical protein
MQSFLKSAMRNLRFLLLVLLLAGLALLWVGFRGSAPDRACRALDGDPTGYVHCLANFVHHACAEPGGKCLRNREPELGSAACHSNGGLWGLNGSKLEHCFFPQEKEACLAKGGSWGPINLASVGGCILQAPDAGKACHSGSECTFGLCLYQRAELHPPVPATGSCVATNRDTSCLHRVENGLVVGSAGCE